MPGLGVRGLLAWHVPRRGLRVSGARVHATPRPRWLEERGPQARIAVRLCALGGLFRRGFVQCPESATRALHTGRAVRQGVCTVTPRPSVQSPAGTPPPVYKAANVGRAVYKPPPKRGCQCTKPDFARWRGHSTGTLYSAGRPRWTHAKCRSLTKGVPLGFKSRGTLPQWEDVPRFEAKLSSGGIPTSGNSACGYDNLECPTGGLSRRRYPSFP